jgi:subtilisin family serine protease
MFAQKQVLIEVRAVAAKELAATLCFSNFELDAHYTPVPLDQSGEHGEPRFVLRGELKGAGGTEEGMARLLEHRNVAAVYVDNEIAPFPVSLETPVAGEEHLQSSSPWVGSDSSGCVSGESRGDLADVAASLGAPWVWAEGVRGDGVVVGIVDGGIAARQRTKLGRPAALEGVVGGWPRRDWGTVCHWGFHGNMAATDVLGLAPRARIYDIRISDAAHVAGRISDALAGFQWAIERFRHNGTPHILSNSWGLYRQEWGPVYATDVAHPFTRKVVEAIDAGILVLFAAGDCGDACPSRECGIDRGPGRSIWGANGHPRVMTVGAANLDGELAGYSSQGPAALDERKPDFCGITDFKGYTRSDSGTSAACAVATGVVALLKQARPEITQPEVKRLLKETARSIGDGPWNPSSGAGVVQARAAYEALLREL